jgi:hypothetical protein
LDFETEVKIPATVTCSDNGQPPLTTTVSITINVVDVNDNAPQFTQPQYNVTVDESTAAEATIIQVYGLF